MSDILSLNHDGLWGPAASGGTRAPSAGFYSPKVGAGADTLAPGTGWNERRANG